MLYVKFGKNGLHGFRGDVVWKFWRTDGRRTPAYTISSPMSLWFRWANKNSYEMCIVDLFSLIVKIPVLFIVVGMWPALSRLPIRSTELGTNATSCHDMFTYLHHSIPVLFTFIVMRRVLFRIAVQETKYGTKRYLCHEMLFPAVSNCLIICIPVCFFAIKLTA